jgi:hypothetical protein
MDAGLLVKLFGQEQHWHGPCTVVVDANAAIQNIGTDSIVSAGTKMYSPRLISGRIIADSVCLLADNSALLLIQQQRLRQQTGDEVVKQTLTIVSIAHIVSLEFCDTGPLLTLGLPAPAPRSTGSHSGTQTRPKVS